MGRSLFDIRIQTPAEEDHSDASARVCISNTDQMRKGSNAEYLNQDELYLIYLRYDE